MNDIPEKYTIDRKKIRKFAALVLDDEQGIRKEAYDVLSEILYETNNGDIANAVDVTDDKAYIGEDVAEELLKGL